MAMQAARAGVHESSGPKVLRVGLIESARIAEERVFRGTDPITIGMDPKCTFAPSPTDAASFPEKAPVFVWRNGGWQLIFTTAQVGRVVVGDKMASLVELIQQEKATPCSDIPNGFALPLSENSRGKISFGQTSVLFQFVEPPPVAPKPQLPTAIRSKPLRGMDWTYNACLSGFLAAAFCALGYVEIGYDPEIDNMSLAEEVRMVRLAVAPNAEPQPTADPQDPQRPAANSRENPQTPANTPNSARNTPRNNNNNNTPRPNSTHERDDAQIAAAIASATRGADAAINAMSRSLAFRDLIQATSGPRSATAMIQNGQGLMNESGDALANVHGIGNATNDQGLHRTGLVASNTPGGNSLGRTNHINAPGNEIGTPTAQPVERVIVARVVPGAIDGPDPEPGMPMNEVAAVFRRNIGAIQACYTAGLRDNPGLRGRVVIDFTIGTSGRVVGMPDVGGLDNAERVHQCMAARVQRYVFPMLTESAHVSFPVNVTPGN